jgi:hypothetical protein
VARSVSVSLASFKYTAAINVVPRLAGGRPSIHRVIFRLESNPSDEIEQRWTHG